VLGLVVGLGLALINSHMSRKSCTASYLALRRIWHDTGLLHGFAVAVSRTRNCVWELS